MFSSVSTTSYWSRGMDGGGGGQRPIEVDRARRQRIRFRIDEMNDSGAHEVPPVIGPAHNPTASRRRSFPKRTKRLSGDRRVHTRTTHREARNLATANLGKMTPRQ